MSSHKVISVLASAVGTILLMTPDIRAVEVQLAWDPATTNRDGIPAQELAGYKVYYGTSSRAYDFVVDVGNRTTYTLSGLKGGHRYYFGVVGYDLSLNESPLSEKVSTITPVDPDSDGMDSDGDGLLDADEIAIYGTDPGVADTDGNGIDDSHEVSFRGEAWDADANGFSDGLEYSHGSDPADPVSTPTPASNDWTNYWVRFTMRSDDAGATGVMFRYQDPDNYYRFSWHGDAGYGQLIKRYNGAFTLLAENAIPYVSGLPYQVDIVADDGTIEVAIEGTLIFSVVDSDLSQGSIGLYTWFNQDSSFDDVLVQDLDTEVVLLEDDFNRDDMTGWTIVDEGTLMAPSAWSVVDGTLSQSSMIYAELTDPADITCYGTYAVYTR